MLERYYTKPATVDRIRALRLGSAISRYAEWLADRQMPKSTVLFKLQVVRKFDEFTRDVALEDLPTRIAPFASRWRAQGHDRYPKPQLPVEELLALAVPGFSRAPLRGPWPLQAHAPDLLAFLRDERGLRPPTLDGYASHLRVFERFLESEKIVELSTLTPAIVTRFLIDSTTTVGAGTKQGRSGVMRVLLRYLHQRGLIASDISRAVPRGRSYKLASLPRSISKSDVDQVLASVDRRSASGKRDYAALMLFATYGLRAQEVAALEFSAIDWEQSRLHIVGRKAGNSTTYPLIGPVGDAIIDYIQHGRPTCSDRHVFLSTTAPYRPVGHWAFSSRATVYLRRAGIRVPRAGSHTFRHSLVQRLVDADLPFKQIGDFVGHRNLGSTQVYAKVAVHKLRALTLGPAEDML